MKRALLVMLLGCGGSSKPADTTPPTPTEKPQPTVVEDTSKDKDKAPPVEGPVAAAEPVSADELESPGAKPPKKAQGGQVAISWTLATDGIDLAKQGKWADASLKFRDAVARVPEPTYFFNLCVTLYQEGKFGEALSACDAVANNGPKPELKTKADRMMARIKTEAKRQQINVSP